MTASGTQGDRPPRRRHGRFVAVAAVLLIGGAAGAVALHPRPAAQWAADTLLADFDPPIAVTVDALTWQAATLSNLRIGADGAVTARRVDLAFDLGWRRVDIATVAVDGATARLGLGPGGLDWGPLAPLLEGDDAAPPVAVSLGPVTLTDGHLALATPYGPLDLALTARVEPTDTKGLSGRVAVTEATLPDLGLVVEAVRGAASFRLENGAPVTLDMTLQSGAVALPLLAVDSTTVDVAFADGRLTATARLQATEGIVEASAAGALPADPTDPAGWTADGRLAVDLTGLALPGLGNRLDLTTALVLAFADQALTFTGDGPAFIRLGPGSPLGRPLALQLADIAGTAAQTAAGPRLRLAADTDARLGEGDRLRGKVDATATRAADGAFRYTATLGDGRADLRAGGRAIGLTLPHVAVEGRDAAATVTLSEAAVDPIDDVALDRITATLTSGASQRLDLTGARLRSLAQPPLVRDLSLAGTATLDKGAVAFDATALGGPITLAVRGRHDLDANKGTATLDLDRIGFAPQGLKPEAAFPVAAGLVDDLTGAVALNGSIDWAAGADVGADLRLLLEDLSFAIGDVRFSRVNSVIAVDHLVPLTTRPDQLASVAAIQVGIPLTDALVTFQVAEGNRLKVKRAALKLAGGEAATENLDVALDDRRQQARLEIRGVDVAELIALAEVDGLSGSGTLAGAVPLSVVDGSVIIENGHLQAVETGIIRYAPPQLPSALQGGGETSNLVVKALRNFHYREMSLTIDRAADGETSARLHLEGFNPDLYEGYPVEFNLNLSGKLDLILSRSLAGYRVPDEIRQRIQRFGR